MPIPKIKINGTWTPIVTIPTTLSSFTNDCGFITSSALPTKTSDLTNDSGFVESEEVTKIYVQSSSPSSAVNGDMWLDTTNSQLKVKQSGSWVSFGGEIPTNISAFTNDVGYMVGVNTSTIFVQGTTPTNSSSGDLWVDTSVSSIPMANTESF